MGLSSPQQYWVLAASGVSEVSVSSAFLITPLPVHKYLSQPSQGCFHLLLEGLREMSRVLGNQLEHLRGLAVPPGLHQTSLFSIVQLHLLPLRSLSQLF